MMVFTTFCLVLITWVLWGFKLGFGTPLVSTFIGDPRRCSVTTPCKARRPSRS